MIKAVVFDFDGTLVDSNQLKQDIFFEIVKCHPLGHQIMEKILNSGFSDRYTIIKEYSYLQKNFKVSYRKLISDYNKLSTNEVSNAREIFGASRLLNKLKKQKIDTYLSSATPRYWLLKIIANRKWDGFFKQIYGFPQNKTASLKKIKCHYKPFKIIVIGDGNDDEESARNLNCTFFKINGRGSKKNSLNSPELQKIIFS